MLYYLHSDYKVPKKSKDESVCDKKLAKKSLLKRNFFSAMTKCESSSKGALIKRRSVTGQQSSNYTSCTSSSSIELKLSTRCLTPFDTYLARYVSFVLSKHFCVCCRRCKKSARFQKSKSNVKVFQEGKSKLKRDLDIVKLIQRSLESKVNSQVHYNPEERFLLGF